MEPRVYFSRSGNIGVLRLGHPEERVVLLTLERMRSLAETLEQISTIADLEGLIITGSGPLMFCTGVNINIIKDVSDLPTAEALAREGQEVMNRIAALDCLTVAAVSGPCVGGGFELTLACDVRLATALPQTRLGLPEVKIGILPGFGGTNRLPRLIGIRKALDIILKARTVPAPLAYQRGKIDRLITLEGANVTPETLYSALLQEASEIARGLKKVSRKSLPFVERILTHTMPGRAIAKNSARASVMKETRGLFPAPLKALDSVMFGLAHGETAGFKEERRLVAELVVSPECKSLIHIFEASEEASKLSKSVRGDVEHAKISVVGGGVMGAGIASAFLSSEFPVAIVEPQAPARDRARGHVENALSRKRSLTDADRNRIKSKFAITDTLTPVRESDVVIEAIIEEIGAKRELFAKLSHDAASHTMLCTNTSSLSVTQIAEGVSNPERVVGLHFFNPAEKMPLVEVVRGDKTSDKNLLKAAALVSRIGKFPVIVEDVPGFLVNRTLSPYLVEAAALLADGYRPEDIETAALDFGMPMGPLRLLDEIGLDVASKVSTTMESRYGDRMKGPRFTDTLLGLGFVGKKSGTGFYVHQGSEAQLDPQIRVKLSITAAEKTGDVKSEITDRLFLPMVFEAVRCLDEGVAGFPGPEAASQIDMATVMGIGFPAFRGGIIFYADSLGAEELKNRAQKYEKFGSRFLPPEGVTERAKSRKPFKQALKAPKPVAKAVVEEVEESETAEE